MRNGLYIELFRLLLTLLVVEL